MSKTSWSVIVSGFFAVASGLISDRWKPIVTPFACSCLAVSCFGWLLAHIQALQAIRFGKIGTKRMTLVVIFVLGGAAVTIVWLLTKPDLPKPPQESHSSAEIAALGNRIDILSNALTQSPSVDGKAQLSILKDEHDRLSEKKDDLTKNEKQILEEQAITLESLESARKEASAKAEVEKRQKAIAQRQAEIEQEDATKKANEALELEERQLTERFVPIYQYAVTRLYEMLEGVAKQSSEKIHSDFPGERPSIERSNLVKDGKLAAGEHVIGLGSHQEWEFHITINGTRESMESMLKGGWTPYSTIFKIQAGGSYVMIFSPRQMIRPPFLRTMLYLSQEQRSDHESTFSEYQKPIDQTLRELIQNRYNEYPLQPKP